MSQTPVLQLAYLKARNRSNEQQRNGLIMEAPVEYSSMSGDEISIPYIQTHFSNLYIGLIGKEKVMVKTWRILGMDPGQQKKFAKRLTREVDRWRQASHHPNIADIVGLTDSPEQSNAIVPSLVVPFCVNRDAKEYLSLHPAASALHLLSGIASGLNHLHSFSPPITHGKLQCSNVLITDFGQPILADMGFSNLPYPQHLIMSHTRDKLDEVRWMAPELIDPPAAVAGSDTEVDIYCVTKESDVHSFSMTGLELITCQKPYAHHRNAYAVIMDITAGTRPPRPVDCRDMSDGVWEMLEKCWAHAPSARPDMGVVESWVRLLDMVDSRKVMD